MFEYTTDVGSVFLTGEFAFSADWSLSLDGVYTWSEAKFNQIEVTLPEETVEPKADYDYSQVYKYSDLEFTQLEVSSLLTWRFTPGSSLYLGVSYFDLQDDAPYVYGDVAGSVLYTRTGVQVHF